MAGKQEAMNLQGILPLKLYSLPTTVARAFQSSRNLESDHVNSGTLRGNGWINISGSRSVNAALVYLNRI